jgi:uncharacterized membrane protein YhaH (DUF805 family)
MRRRSTKKRFWNAVLIHFLIYLVVLPLLFYILDSQTVKKLVKKDAFLFILEIAGIALAISIIVSFWSRKDPELRRW